jgi:hypothetical protein
MLRSAACEPVQKLAREKYALWKRDPYHASLRFEERRNGICVIRIGNHYRAVALREGDVVAWFWIGTTKNTIVFVFSFLPLNSLGTCANGAAGTRAT